MTVNRLRYRLASPWLALLRLRRRFQPQKGGFRALLFHDIRASQIETFRRFSAQAVDRFGALSPDEAGRMIDPRTPPVGGSSGFSSPPRLLFTFDDGFESNFRVARDILSPLGVRALFFVCPKIIDSPRDAKLAFAKQLSPNTEIREDQDPFMTWEQLAALVNDGHVVGSHGQSHRRLTDLEPNELTTELEDSRAALKKNLDTDAQWFAFPFGDVSSISGEVLSQIGRRYAYCRSGVRGVNGAGTNPLCVFSDHIDLDAPDAYRDLTLEGGLDGRYSRDRQWMQSILPDGTDRMTSG